MSGTPALTEEDFSFFLKRGGSLVACGSWTDNTGTSTQDLFWVISTEGELLFYQGSWPGSDSWSIVARFIIGKPCGYRCHIHVENDLWFITSQGIVPVSVLFQSGASVAQNSVSRKINKVIQTAAASTAFSYMYSGKYWALGRRVFITYPVSTTNNQLLVCNMETGAWTVYRYGVDGAALSFEISDDLPYTGSNGGIVYSAESGYDDNGSSIEFRVRGGSNFFGKRGQYKAFKDIRPILKVASDNITFYLDIDLDFRQLNTYATITIPNSTATDLSSWDTASWDVDSWSEEERYLFDRYSLKGQGHSGALRIKGNIDALLEFNAFEIRFEEGAQV
jgi:hypothetical protein